MTDTISLFKLLEESPVNNDILKVENDGHNEFTIYCRNEESTIVLANHADIGVNSEHLVNVLGFDLIPAGRYPAIILGDTAAYIQFI